MADALKKLPIGRVVFNVPPTLKLGEVAVIHVALSLQETHKQLEERITEIGVIEGGELSVSDDMRATLTGADFEILPLLDERQAVSAEDTTEWLWQVKPVVTGVRLLKLTLYAFVSVGDKESSRSVKSFTKDLKIHVTWAERVSEFAGGNWQWLWTAILVPLAAFVMARRHGGATPHHR